MGDIPGEEVSEHVRGEVHIRTLLLFDPYLCVRRLRVQAGHASFHPFPLRIPTELTLDHLHAEVAKGPEVLPSDSLEKEMITVLELLKCHLEQGDFKQGLQTISTLEELIRAQEEANIDEQSRL